MESTPDWSLVQMTRAFQGVVDLAFFGSLMRGARNEGRAMGTTVPEVDVSDQL